MGRGGKKRSRAADSALELSLSSGSSRRRVAPQITVVKQPSATDPAALLAELAPEQVNQWEWRYDDAKASETFRLLGVEEASLTYAGGNDEGSVEEVTVTFADGHTEDWNQWAMASVPDADKPEDLLRWHLCEVLWSPAAAEFGSFAGEFNVNGRVTWTPEEEFEHTFDSQANPDVCERCENEYPADTVTFKEIHPCEGDDRYSEYVCPDCYAQVESGDDPEWTTGESEVGESDTENVDGSPATGGGLRLTSSES